MFDIDAALMTVIETQGSDLHLKVPAPPIVRRHGELEPISGAEALSSERGARYRSSAVPFRFRSRPPRSCCYPQ